MAEMKIDPVSWVIGAVVLALAAFSIITAYLNHETYAQNQECVISILQQQNDALRARAHTAKMSDDATKTLIVTVFHAKTKAQSFAAFHKYEQTQNNVQTIRSANPYPRFPEGRCQ